jgi:prepilin peptidase CpaA
MRVEWAAGLISAAAFFMPAQPSLHQRRGKLRSIRSTSCREARMFESSFLLLLILPALVILGGMSDATRFKIPNWISGVAVLTFSPVALIAGAPLGVIGAHLGIGAAGLALAMGMWSLGWIGGGDAKLFAASSLWLGWPAVGLFALVTALAGGALSVALLNLRSGWMRAIVPAGPAWIERLREPGGKAPYGVAIAIGALAAFPTSDLVRLAIG